jgi:hypothetical protein
VVERQAARAAAHLRRVARARVRALGEWSGRGARCQDGAAETFSAPLRAEVGVRGAEGRAFLVRHVVGAGGYHWEGATLGGLGPAGYEVVVADWWNVGWVGWC